MRSVMLGTPCIVVACDTEDLKLAPAALGFPACRGEAEKDAQSGSLCTEVDPQVAFEKMMRKGTGLFVTPSVEAAKSQQARARIEQFSQRPDLFFKLFDDGRLTLFAAAFSEYFPRRPLRVSS